jgi:large subunit ribosomal protein L5
MVEKIKKQKIEKETSKVKAQENVMRKIKLEKVVLNCGGTEDKLERSAKLLNILTGKTIKKVASSKRIPSFGVRPGLVTGCLVTLRGDEKEALLKRLFGAINNKISPKKIANNHFSFGIKEYLEIPDMEYQRDIGIVGFDVTAVFTRAGKRINLKKIKQGKTPKKQEITKEEIIDYLQNKLGVNVEEKI